MTTKHAPGKLAIEGADRHVGGYYITGASFKIFFCTIATDIDAQGRRKRMADADRIVHTWNCHDELVEALDNLLDAVSDLRGVDIEGCYAIEEVAKARAIIAKAKGK